LTQRGKKKRELPSSVCSGLQILPDKGYREGEEGKSIIIAGLGRKTPVQERRVSEKNNNWIKRYLMAPWGKKNRAPAMY